jgi:RpiB/LacA/LacB family sugar-phosphate isomerase
MQRKFVVGSDNVGYPLKQAVVNYLRSNGVEVLDVGPGTPEVTVDYPDFAQEVCRYVAAGEYQQGILVCGTGIGMSIAANKQPGIRAALCHDVYTAHQARAHNDANVLCLGVWIVSPQRAEGILKEWLETPYEAGRHVVRLMKLAASQNQSVPFSPLDDVRFSVALSPRRSSFGPLLFMGQFEKGLAAAAEAGFDMVELSLLTPQDIASDELSTLLERHNLGVSAVATGQSCIHEGLCLASPDVQAREATVERLKQHVAFAARFNAPVIIGGIRGRFSGSPDDFAMQRRNSISAVQDCARYAAEQGTHLLVETINRYETNFLNNTLEGLAYLDEVGEPNVKLLLDTFHMNIEEISIPAAIELAGARLGYIHFADSNRRAPGQGHTNFSDVVAALGRIGFTGVISAEILPIPDDLTAIRQAGSFFKSLRNGKAVHPERAD